MSQQAVLALIDTESSARLHQATVDTRQKAWLTCVAREGARDWLSAQPSKALGLHLRPAEKYRIGILVFRQEAISNIHGDHVIICAIRVERIAKHNHLRD